MKRIYFFLPAFLAIVLSCNITKIIQPDEAGKEVVLNGKTLYLSTYLWRDFMPVADRDGSALIGSLKIKEVNGKSFTPDFFVTKVGLFDGESPVWFTEPEDKTPHWNSTENQAELSIRNGPKLDPGLKLTVVIAIKQQNNHYLLKAEDQEIQQIY